MEHDENYYKKWAEDYLQSANIIEGKIKELNKRKKKASSDQLSVITHDLDILHDSYYDCIEIASILVHKARREKCKKQISTYS